MSVNFRCKIHEPLYTNIYNSYVNQPFEKNILNYGGRASGKSHAIGDNVVFWLPENNGDIAIFVVYSAQHKTTTSTLIENKLINHGYGILTKNNSNGDVVYFYGNDSLVYIKSMETSSIEQLGEKFKNFEIPTNKRIKFLCFEEFTACLNVFRGDLRKFENVLSSFNRHMDDKSITFFTTNPPENKTHIFYTWIEKNPHLYHHFSTIFDLPKHFQSELDIKTAERLQKSDKETFEHIYLGKATSSGGLAFNVNNIYIKPNSKEYVKFWVQTDEATSNATVFTLIGLTSDGLVAVKDIYYHASRLSNDAKAMSTYANDFYTWLNDNQVDDLVEIGTDSLLFTMELLKFGFPNVESVGKIKNRPLSYQLLNKLINENTFKIEQKPSTQILYKQLLHAEKEITANGAVVNKKYEMGNNEEKHVHSVDTILYWCLRLQREIIDE